MELANALTALGVNRSVWIDDYFDSEIGDLFLRMYEDAEATSKVDFEGLRDAIPNEYDPEGESLRNFIDGLSKGEKRALEALFLAEQSSVHGQAVKELSERAIDRTGKLLGVKDTDRISFGQAEKSLPAICGDGDEHVGYIVDLTNRDGSRDGLNTLGILSANGSKGTFFILTHEAARDGEADLESVLRAQFAELNPGLVVPPICVISKERLETAGEDNDELANQLKVALKRAGLRRSVHGVLQAVQRSLVNAMTVATDQILEIPPEHLDKFMVERAYNEGVSELHVVERALTATVSEQLRVTFMGDNEVAGHIKRIRALQPVEIRPGPSGAPHANLDVFRRMEIWEEGPVINAAHSPLSCGDVFVLDVDERARDAAERRFILLGQQCDIQLRSDGRRAQSYAFFVPIVEASEEWVRGGNKAKAKLLPFSLNGRKWKIDYRYATQVRLSVLDLATFRSDGKVAFFASQVSSGVPDMLPGLQKHYPGVVKSVLDVFKSPPDKTQEMKDVGCQLTFTSDGQYKGVHLAKFKKSVASKGVPATEDRLTWGLVREGRIRAPYSSSLLRDFLSISGRDAFDLDFASAPELEEDVGSGCAAGACAV